VQYVLSIEPKMIIVRCP